MIIYSFNVSHIQIQPEILRNVLKNVMTFYVVFKNYYILKLYIFCYRNMNVLQMHWWLTFTLVFAQLAAAYGTGMGKLLLLNISY